MALELREFLPDKFMTFQTVDTISLFMCESYTLYFTLEAEGDNISDFFSDSKFYSLDAEILV